MDHIQVTWVFHFVQNFLFLFQTNAKLSEYGPQEVFNKSYTFLPNNSACHEPEDQHFTPSNWLYNFSAVISVTDQMRLSVMFDFNLFETTFYYNVTSFSWWIKCLFALIQLFIHIPFCIFKYVLSFIIFQTYEISIDLFVHRDLQTILLVICLILLLCHIRRTMNYWKRRNIPYECITANIPIIGNIANFLNLNDVCRVRRYGKVFGSYRLMKPILCVADYRAVEEILYLNSDCFAQQNTWSFEGHFLSESTFANSTPDINRWKRKKSILLSSFLSRRIKLLRPSMDDVVDELVNYLKLHCAKSSSSGRWQTKLESLVLPWLLYSMLSLVIDIELPKYHKYIRQDASSAALIRSCRKFVHIHHHLQRYYLLNCFPTLFSLVNFHLLNRVNLKQVKKVISDAIEYRMNNGLVGLPVQTCSHQISQPKKSVKFNDEVCVSLFSPESDHQKLPKAISLNQAKCAGQTSNVEHRAAKLQALTFIDIILDYEIEPEDKIEGHVLSKAELVDNLTGFFTVSLSTLSKTISAVLFYLALYPNEQDTVRQEIVDHVEHRCNISWESVRNMKYTEAFIKEVLRLSSPIEHIERTVTKSCKIELDKHTAYHLDPGTVCSILVSAIHRDPQYYPEPDRFQPSRFYVPNMAPESPTIEKPSLGESRFLAFGMGSRTCIGLKFVMFYLKHFLANVLLEFEFQMCHKSGKRYRHKRIEISQILSSQIEIVAKHR